VFSMSYSFGNQRWEVYHEPDHTKVFEADGWWDALWFERMSIVQ